MTIGTGIAGWVIIGGGGGANQFTEEQKVKLLALIYTNSVATIVCDPATGERGKDVAVSVKYQIQSNDDVFGSASINNGVGNVLANINTGQKTAAIGNKVSTTTVALTMAYNRNGANLNETKNATYTTYLPQWAGISALAEFTTYAQLEAAGGMQKYSQASSAIERVLSPVAQYVYFIVASGTGKIFDGNGFELPVGAWGDPDAEYWRKPLVLTLANGVATGNLFLIRSREQKTFNALTIKST